MTALDRLPDETPAHPTSKVPQKTIYKIDRKDIAKELSNRGEYKLAQRLAGCRQQYFLHQCTNCAHPVISGSHCNSKICPECGGERLTGLFNREVKYIKSLMGNPHSKTRLAMLVFSPKNIKDSDYSSDSYKKLRKDFKKFLNHPRIKGKIHGGLIGMETKRPLEGSTYKQRDGTLYNIPKGRDWNIHIHALVYADFISWRVLRGICKEATGDSHHIDIKEAKFFKYSIYETLKYVIKPGNLGDAESYAHFLIETKNVRLMSTFGCFRSHFKLTEKGEYLCSLCGCGMEFITKISEKEALRWEQFMKGPPIDIFGNFNDMGFPTLAVLRYHGPGLKPWAVQQTTKMEV